jgi:hypothetical protein
MRTSYSLKLQGIMFTLIFGLLVFVPIQAASVQAASSTTVNVVPSSSTRLLGETFTVNITISNVQNLYALDVTLSWNTSVLQVLNVNSRLGVESHSDGVLHENLPNYPIDILEESLSPETGEYHIAATSVGQASSFSGSGNVAILTFNVTNFGQTGFGLESELADQLVPGEQNANFIEHTDSIGTVNIIPEFPSIIAVGLLLAFATTVVVFSKKRLQQAARSI